MEDTVATSSVLLTGATSGTGRRLARRLLERGARVRCLVHTPERASLLPTGEPGLEVVHGSAEDADDLRRILRGVETVVHLAGHRFTPLLLRVLAEEDRPLRLVAQSSTRALSRYLTPTRESVRRAEAAVETAPGRVSWTILQPSMIFGGPEDRNVERIAAQARRGRFFPVFGRGRALRQPLFVHDLVEAHLAALGRPEAIGKTYTLAGAEAIPFRELVRAVARASGAPEPRFVTLPLGASLLAARALKRLWPGSPLNPEAVERFGEDMEFDISPARRDLEFTPTPLEEALERKFRGEA